MDKYYLEQIEQILLNRYSKDELFRVFMDSKNPDDYLDQLLNKLTTDEFYSL